MLTKTGVSTLLNHPMKNFPYLNHLSEPLLLGHLFQPFCSLSSPKEPNETTQHRPVATWPCDAMVIRGTAVTSMSITPALLAFSQTAYAHAAAGGGKLLAHGDRNWDITGITGIIGISNWD